MTSYLPIITAESELSAYISKINNFAYLTEEEERDLALSYKNGNIKDAEKLVTSHLRLVVKIAYTYRNYGLSMMDLICEGNLGLMQAVKKFDVSKGFRLSTYAMWWIKAYIQDYILKSYSLVKIGSSALQKKLFFNLGKVKQKLRLYDQDCLTDKSELIARELGVSSDDVRNMDARLSNGDIYLSEKVGNDDDAGELIDIIEDKSENQEMICINNQEHDTRLSKLQAAITQLNEREQFVIQNRKLTETPLTLEDISEIYGISKERVRQIEARAMEKLQEFVSN